jgi:hypothetical protein
MLPSPQPWKYDTKPGGADTINGGLIGDILNGDAGDDDRQAYTRV